MIILDTTTRSLEIKLTAGIAVSQLPFMASFVEIGSNLFDPKSNSGQSNGTTAVTAVAAPASARQRQVKFMSLRNADNAARTAIIQLNDNATIREITRVTLDVGDTLIYTDGEGFRVMNPSGQIKGVGASGATGPQGDPGNTTTGTAGETLSALRIVAVDDSTGKIVYADKDELDEIHSIIGMTTNAPATDESASILTGGIHTDGGWSWNMAGDVSLFLGANGAIVQGPAPSGLATVKVGFAMSATKIFLRIGTPIINA